MLDSLHIDTFETIIGRLLISVVIGGIIGLERAYHGRVAGLRTHTLVCSSSALLMLVTVFQWAFLKNAPLENIRVDPTRMAQGVMTGIGFLGAGVIMKEKFSIRGLTTAASIWMTSSIGITVGLGFYTAAVSATLFTLIILSSFAWFERKLPTYQYGNLMVRLKRDKSMTKSDLFKIVEKHNIIPSNPSFHLINEGQFQQYEFTIRSNNPNNFEKLNETLCNIDLIIEFRIIPMGG